MDFRDSPDEAAFRERLRGWLTEQKGKFPTSGDEYWAAQGDWHQALYGAGFFGTSWPKEYGGQDLPPVYDVIVDEEIAKAGAPARPSLGYLVVGLSHHEVILLGRKHLLHRFIGHIDGAILIPAVIFPHKKVVLLLNHADYREGLVVDQYLLV